MPLTTMLGLRNLNLLKKAGVATSDLFAPANLYSLSIVVLLVLDLAAILWALRQASELMIPAPRSRPRSHSPTPSARAPRHWPDAPAARPDTPAARPDTPAAQPRRARGSARRTTAAARHALIMVGINA